MRLNFNRKAKKGKKRRGERGAPFMEELRNYHKKLFFCAINHKLREMFALLSPSPLPPRVTEKFNLAKSHLTQKEYTQFNMAWNA